MSNEISFITLPDRRLAYQQLRAAPNQNKPGVIFLSGYGSDMMGTKAGFLAERCAAAGRAFLRFDYRGVGQSSGKFIDGTIGTWFEDTALMFDQLTTGPQLIIGSSMGGWLGLMLVKQHPHRVSGFIGIAAAPDFTENLVRPQLNDKQRTELEQDGVTYDENAPQDFRLPMTKKFLDEAEQHLLLNKPLQINAPVHLLQGEADTEVPFVYAKRIATAITAPTKKLTLIKDGDHRLSRPADLALLWDVLETYIEVPSPTG